MSQSSIPVHNVETAPAYNVEPEAMAIHWAAWEMYPPTQGNPVGRMTPQQAWEKTSDAHRALCRLQAQMCVEQFLKRVAARAS